LAYGGGAKRHATDDASRTTRREGTSVRSSEVVRIRINLSPAICNQENIGAVVIRGVRSSSVLGAQRNVLRTIYGAVCQGGSSEPSKSATTRADVRAHGVRQQLH
jgi:hypothetical protein